MPALARVASNVAGEADQRVFLNNVSWSDYEAILAIRGESASVRITYLQGALELLSPSINHEAIKKMIARLVEAYAEERDLDLNGYGSWTIRNKLAERGLEPDECYVLGSHEPERPDLAIEVIWTSGGIDKLEVYRGLGVPEVWMWNQGAIEVHVLRDGAYQRIAQSELLPDIDLAHLASFLDEPSQTRAVRAYRASLGANQRKS